MSYENRNSLILLIFLVVLGVGGYLFVKAKFGKDFSTVEKELKTKEDRLKNLQTALADIDVYEKLLKETSEKLKYYPKVILPEQTISQTYRYLEEIDRYGTFFNFKFALQGVQRKDNVSTASYELSGEGNFPKILRFVKRIEYGMPLYKIELLTLHRKSQKAPVQKQSEGDLEVQIKLAGIFFTQIKDPELVTAIFYPIIQESSFSEYDPFSPLILDYLPPNTENLLVIENCQLIALTAQTAFVQLPNTAVQQLSIGDRVYLGYLKTIDLNKGEARFAMDRGGISDIVALRIKPSSKGVK